MAKQLPYPVHLEKPDPKSRKGWRATYVDPDDRHKDARTPGGRLRKQKVTLQAQGDTNADSKRRQDERVRMSRKLAKRWNELQDGATAQSGKSIEEALETYYETVTDPVTERGYRDGTDRFVDWCHKQRVYSCDGLTRGTLIAFRRQLLKDHQALSGTTFDNRLRAVKTAITYLIDEELIARVSYDDLRRVKLLNKPTERGEIHTPHQCQRILESALRHDEAVYEATRWKAGEGRSEKHKYPPIAPFVACSLLACPRPKESRSQPYTMPGKPNDPAVDLEFLDQEGNPTGRIVVPKQIAKTRKQRDIHLKETPLLRALLAAMKLSSGGVGKVFSLSENDTTNARKRLIKDFGSPHFTWYSLRRTGLTHLCNAPGIYGGASIYLTAARGGHGVDVCEKHYVGQVPPIDPTLHTLEEVLQITEQVREIIDEVKARGNVRRLRTA